MINCTDPVFHAAAAADIEVVADEAFVAEPFLGPCEGAFLLVGGEFFQGRFENVAQPPLGLDEELTAKSIARVFDDGKAQSHIVANELLQHLLAHPLFAVPEGRPPVQAHKLIDLSALTVLDQKSNADESAETQDEGSLITTPLFWIAVVGWFLVVLLLIVVILLAN